MTDQQDGASNVRVVIADDHEIVRAGVRALVDAQAGFEVVGEAATGQAACQLAQSLTPDIVVLDLSMPDGGMYAAECIARDCPTVKIVVLTMHEERGYFRRLVRAGAAAYVLKRTASSELVRALHVVMSGGTYVDASLAGSMIEHSSAGAQNRESRGEGDLTVRELEIIRMVARGNSNKETAGSLEISVKTVESHKSNAMAKLGISSRAALVRFALDEGWMT